MLGNCPCSPAPIRSLSSPTSSDDKAERLLALGADDVINYRTAPDWHKIVRTLTRGRGRRSSGGHRRRDPGPVDPIGGARRTGQVHRTPFRSRVRDRHERASYRRRDGPPVTPAFCAAIVSVVSFTSTFEQREREFLHATP